MKGRDGGGGEWKRAWYGPSYTSDILPIYKPLSSLWRGTAGKHRPRFSSDLGKGTEAPCCNGMSWGLWDRTYFKVPVVLEPEWERSVEVGGVS